jgi:cytochrome c oxidase cbb3-type subunit 3
MATRKSEAPGEPEIRGHQWDGIGEYDNPLPRWWLWTFYATLLWGLVYTIAFPAWPMITRATQGLLGYDSRVAVLQELDAAAAARQPFRDRIAALDLEAIAADDELRRFATTSGAATFRTYCSQCHGAGAAGNPGYPNLLDDDWVWGGDLAAIEQTITHGIRVPDDADTRVGEMPAFGRDQLLEPAQIAAVTEYVLALSGQEHEASRLEEGKAVFAEQCASCHGEDGRGMRDMGGPNLADAIWLYGGAREAILATLHEGRAGMMPAWKVRLSPEQIREVTVYVHSLGGGE